MDIRLTLENKEINPGVINLRQYASRTDVLVFAIYETTDLSKLDAYAVCFKPDGRTDEVMLTKTIVNEQLRITWKVTGYTTQEDGTLTYQIVFKNMVFIFEGRIVNDDLIV